MNPVASSAASTIGLMRTRSSGRILQLRSTQDLVAKVPAQVVRRAQVDLAAAVEARQLRLHRGKPDQAWFHSGREFDQQVDVAVRLRRASQHGAEQRKALDVVPLAAIRERRCGGC